MMTPDRCPDCHTFLDPKVAAGLCPRCLVTQATGTPQDGPQEPNGLREELVKVLPGYELLECLGIGGMGAVYKARQRRLDRLVAIKVLLTPPAEVEGWSERFEREARALARLSHKNVIGVHDFGQAEGLSYLVLEYVEGANLRQLMAAGRLSTKEALAIIPQVCDALQYAHEEGVVHRDVKPENILMDLTGHVKIADFGLAKIVDRPASFVTLTGSQQAMGTFRYMAPEQVDRPREVDHRADIYSLGAVVYEMLTGEVPVGRFEPPSQLREGLDPRFDEVVLRALERTPERRYDSARDMRADLAAAQDGTGPLPGYASHTAGSQTEWPRDKEEWRSSVMAWITPPRDLSLFTPILCLLGMGLSLVEGTVKDRPFDPLVEGSLPGGLAMVAFSLPLVALVLSGWREDHQRFQISRLLTCLIVAVAYGTLYEERWALTDRGEGIMNIQHALAAPLALASVLHYLGRIGRRLGNWRRPEKLHDRLRLAVLAFSGAGLLSVIAQEAFGRDWVFKSGMDLRAVTFSVIGTSFLLNGLLRLSLRGMGLVRLEGLTTMLFASMAAAASIVFMAEVQPDVGPVMALTVAVPSLLVGLFEFIAGGGSDSEKLA